PHTALRHRSSSGMRSAPSSNLPGEPVGAEAGEPAVIEPADPEPSSGGVLDAGQLGHPEMHVAVDGCELPVRVAVPEVVAPPPQHRGEVSDDRVQLAAGEAAVGAIT